MPESDKPSAQGSFAKGFFFTVGALTALWTVGLVMVLLFGTTLISLFVGGS